MSNSLKVAAQTSRSTLSPSPKRGNAGVRALGDNSILLTLKIDVNPENVSSCEPTRTCKTTYADKQSLENRSWIEIKSMANFEVVHTWRP